jgi:hypothetical protein
MKKDEWNADEIVTDVDIKFGWQDRIRVLFGRVTWVRVQVKTENIVGRTTSSSMVHVHPIFPNSHGPGMAESATEVIR